MFPGALRSGVGRTVFEEQYHCFSVAVSGRSHLEDGDKILLPPSALDTLARMSVAYPMLFELKNATLGKRTHCGVLEFTAEEGRCYLPFWMMQGLFMEEGALITVKNVMLPKATFVKLQAQNVDFLKITNPKAVMEVALRKFTCLTKGDVICMPYAGKNYYLEATEVMPGGAASIVEADFNVDFDEPVGYQQSEYGIAERAAKEKLAQEAEAKKVPVPVPASQLQKAYAAEEATAAAPKFQPFQGTSYRIDGKSKPHKASDSPAAGSTGTGSGSNSGSNSNNVSRASPAIPSSSSSSISSPAAAARPSSASTSPAVPAPTPAPYRSTIGSKYAKNKNSVTAFSGTGHKLNG